MHCKNSMLGIKPTSEVNLITINKSKRSKKISSKTKNFLRVRGKFEAAENCSRFPRTVWHSENCLQLPRTVWDFWELFETFENCLRLPRTVWDSRELSETFKKSLRLPRTVWDFWELLETSENCFKLPRTVWHLQELCEILRKLQKEPWNQCHHLKKCCCFSYQQFPFFLFVCFFFRFSRRSLLFYS